MCRPVNTFCGLGVETGRRTSSARLQRIACGAGTADVSKRQRRRSESNRRIEVLQTSALPLGYGAGGKRNLATHDEFGKSSRSNRLARIMAGGKNGGRLIGSSPSPRRDRHGC